MRNMLCMDCAVAYGAPVVVAGQIVREAESEGRAAKSMVQFRAAEDMPAACRILLG